jgi:hypothetical protein
VENMRRIVHQREPDRQERIEQAGYQAVDDELCEHNTTYHTKIVKNGQYPLYLYLYFIIIMHYDPHGKRMLENDPPTDGQRRQGQWLDGCRL